MEDFFDAKSWNNIIYFFYKESKEGKYEELNAVDLIKDPYSKEFYDSVELKLIEEVEERFYLDNSKREVKVPIYMTPKIIFIGYNDKDYCTFKTEFLINDNSLGSFLFNKIFSDKGDETMASVTTNKIEYSKNTADLHYSDITAAATAAAAKRNVAEMAYKIDSLSSGSSAINNIYDSYNTTYHYDYYTIMNNKVDKAEYESLNDRVKKLENKDKEKEKDTMMKNLEFGPCGDDVRISAYGLAIRNNSNEWVSYNSESNEILNVDILNISNSGKYIYKMPVAVSDVKVGDVIIHNKVPMFVSKVNDDKTFAVVDVKSGEAKTIIPTKSPFGFNFMVKIVSLLGTLGDKASADKPFGNILPFLLMDDNKDNSAMMMYALMQGENDISANPMMLMALLDGKSVDPMMLMMLSSNFKNPNVNTLK